MRRGFTLLEIMLALDRKSV
ncbi:MAG: prepilin-type N-terminal cleavage/methylation domain-containing protein, partial [Phycisphaerales bacterium]